MGLLDNFKNRRTSAIGAIQKAMEQPKQGDENIYYPERDQEGGANVIHGRVNNVHTSGHGGQEELKMMVRLTKPNYMIPVHGEYRMQVNASARRNSMPMFL